MDLKRALQTYTVLTIGDGLVTVIPALMISISGGLIVTRASSDAKLGMDFQRQVFGNPQPLLLASGVLIAMAAFPGLPKIPFLVLGRWCRRDRRGGCGKKLPPPEKGQRPPPASGAREPGGAAARRAAGGGGRTGLVQLVEGGQNSRCSSESPASAGSWPPNSAIFCRRCGSPTT